MIELKISADSAEELVAELWALLGSMLGDEGDDDGGGEEVDYVTPELTGKGPAVVITDEELEVLTGKDLDKPKEHPSLIFADNAENTYTDPEGVPEGSEVIGVELDAEGIPWDGRIHVDSKNKVKDGTWRLKRKLDEAYVESVKAELKACADPAPVETATQETPEAEVAANPMVNHSQLLEQMVADFASGALNIFTVSNVVLKHGLSSLKDAEGKPELIQEIAKELGVI
jgi:hypothetical protein